MMKQEWKKGWKVITPHRESCTWRDRLIQSKCYYSINEITKRPKRCGPLAVFRTRQNARDFKKTLEKNIISFRNHNFKIVRCVYKGSKDNCLWEWFWHNKNYPLHFLPEGTAFADEIKCLE